GLHRFEPGERDLERGPVLPDQSPKGRVGGLKQDADSRNAKRLCGQFGVEVPGTGLRRAACFNVLAWRHVALIYERTVISSLLIKSSMNSVTSFAASSTATSKWAASSRTICWTLLRPSICFQTISPTSLSCE